MDQGRIRLHKAGLWGAVPRAHLLPQPPFPARLRWVLRRGARRRHGHHAPPFPGSIWMGDAARGFCSGNFCARVSRRALWVNVVKLFIYTSEFHWVPARRTDVARQRGCAPALRMLRGGLGTHSPSQLPRGAVPSKTHLDVCSGALRPILPAVWGLWHRQLLQHIWGLVLSWGKSPKGAGGTQGRD